MGKTPIEIMLDQVEYKPTGAVPNTEGLPYETHTGTLKLGEMELDVSVLNTGQRVISSDALEKFFGEGFMESLHLKWTVKYERQ